MVKHGIFKAAGVGMAGRAGSSPMICRRRVAACAILRPNRVVVKHRIGKVLRVTVTGGAGTRKVVGRWGMTGGAILVTN